MPTEASSGRGGVRPPIDFDRAPFLVIWETTRACDLACKHCRAEAIPCRDSGELSTVEAMRLMNDVRHFGRIVFVLSGGDCLKRPDVVDLVEHGAQIGLRMAATPATTPLASTRMIRRLRDAGLARLAVSLDGSSAEIHDAFRRVDGSFAHGLRILRESRDVGLSTQANTVIGRHNLDDVERTAELLAEAGIVFWEVFFLVPTGRAKPEDVASAEAFEDVFHRLYDLSKTMPFDIKATAAPHYGRVVLQRKVAERRAGQRQDAADVLTDGVAYSQLDGIGRARNVNDGDGFVFISHTGEIMPSGFLPVPAGNVRTDDLADVYRTHPLFVALRDRDRLEGKCGVCEYRDVCGGSRARAHAMTGNWHASEPFCSHIPKRWARMIERGELQAAPEPPRARVRPLPLLKD